MDDRTTRQQDLARLLMEKARQDLALIEMVGGSHEIADEVVGFHAQQAIEKALKAVLTRLGIEYRYTHDLSLLYAQVEDAGATLPAALDSVEDLTGFAVQFRYMLLTQQTLDRDTVAMLAAEFIAWAERLVELSDPTSADVPPDSPASEAV